MLLERKDSANDSDYAGSMDQDQTFPEPKAVGRNLALLMKWKGWNQTEVSRRSEVSQRHISDVLRGLTDPTTEIIEKLAGAFGVQVWQMVMGDITEELLTSTDLRLIVETYISTPAGRKLIEGAAEMVRKTGS